MVQRDRSTLDVYTDKEGKTHDRLTMSVSVACLFFFPAYGMSTW